MPKVTNRLKTTLVPQEYPPDSSRSRRAENRNLQRTMGDTGEKRSLSQSPSSEDADEKKVKVTHTDSVDVSTLTKQKRYICQTKVTEAERKPADWISWMESLDANPEKTRVGDRF